MSMDTALTVLTVAWTLCFIAGVVVAGAGTMTSNLDNPPPQTYYRIGAILMFLGPVGGFIIGISALRKQLREWAR
jgi:hypothetical protein